MRILIVEDEPGIAESVRRKLAESYTVDLTAKGKEGLYLAQTNEYDLLILDLGLPDLGGLEICKRLRGARVQVPILILTVQGSVEQKIEALDAGADDYLTKPFSLKELLARVRAMLRRSPSGMTSNVLTVADLSLDLINRVVYRHGCPVALRRKEFDLLEYLMRNQGQTLTRGMIIEHLWGDDRNPFTNAVDVHIKYLRDKVDKPFASTLIKTVHGVGYKLE